MLKISPANYVKCFTCEEPIGKGEDIYEYLASNPELKAKRYHRIHKNCHDLYQDKKIENEKWDNLYEYVRTNILGYDISQRLDSHKVSRLQGMRTGSYGHKVNKKVSLSETGYPYEVILMAFKVKRVAIDSAIKERSKFKNDKHMFDYIMIIVESEINDVYIRMKEREITNKKLDELDYSKFQGKEYEFKNKVNIKENKVANLLNDLW